MMRPMSEKSVWLLLSSILNENMCSGRRLSLFVGVYCLRENGSTVQYVRMYWSVHGTHSIYVSMWMAGYDLFGLCVWVCAYVCTCLCACVYVCVGGGYGCVSVCNMYYYVRTYLLTLKTTLLRSFSGGSRSTSWALQEFPSTVKMLKLSSLSFVSRL